MFFCEHETNATAKIGKIYLSPTKCQQLTLINLAFLNKDFEGLFEVVFKLFLNRICIKLYQYFPNLHYGDGF